MLQQDFLCYSSLSFDGLLISMNRVVKLPQGKKKRNKNTKNSPKPQVLIHLFIYIADFKHEKNYSNIKKLFKNKSIWY